MSRPGKTFAADRTVNIKNQSLMNHKLVKTSEPVIHIRFQLSWCLQYHAYAVSKAPSFEGKTNAGFGVRANQNLKKELSGISS